MSPPSPTSFPGQGREVREDRRVTDSLVCRFMTECPEIRMLMGLAHFNLSYRKITIHTLLPARSLAYTDSSAPLSTSIVCRCMHAVYLPIKEALYAVCLCVCLLVRLHATQRACRSLSIIISWWFKGGLIYRMKADQVKSFPYS